MDNKLKNMFDYQKFEDNEKLKAVCDAVNSKYSNKYEMTDDELDMVAGGKAQTLERKK